MPRQSAIHSQEQLISKFRFSLISLAIVVIPIAWLSLYIQRQLNTPEIQFREFTWAKMEKEVSHGKTVLMYCTMYKDLIPHQFSNKTLRRSYHEGNFIAMKLTYSDWSEPEINNIFKQVGHTKYPMTILFKPNEWPARIDSVSAEQWLELGLIRRPQHDSHVAFYGIATIAILAIYSIVILRNRRANRQRTSLTLRAP